MVTIFLTIKKIHQISVIKIKALPNEPITIKLIDDKYRCIISVRSPITGESKDCYLKKIFLHNSGPAQLYNRKFRYNLRRSRYRKTCF